MERALLGPSPQALRIAAYPSEGNWLSPRPSTKTTASTKFPPPTSPALAASARSTHRSASPGACRSHPPPVRNETTLDRRIPARDSTASAALSTSTDRPRAPPPSSPSPHHPPRTPADNSRCHHPTNEDLSAGAPVFRPAGTPQNPRSPRPPQNAAAPGSHLQTQWFLHPAREAASWRQTSPLPQPNRSSKGLLHAMPCRYRGRWARPRDQAALRLHAERSTPQPDPFANTGRDKSIHPRAASPRPLDTAHPVRSAHTDRRGRPHPALRPIACRASADLRAPLRHTPLGSVPDRDLPCATPAHRPHPARALELSRTSAHGPHADTPSATAQPCRDIHSPPLNVRCPQWIQSIRAPQQSLDPLESIAGTVALLAQPDEIAGKPRSVGARLECRLKATALSCTAKQILRGTSLALLQTARQQRSDVERLYTCNSPIRNEQIRPLPQIGTRTHF